MKQKLLLTINSLRSGGAERVVSHLLNHLQDDFEIHLALYNNAIGYDIPADIKIVDLKQSEDSNQLITLLKLPTLSYRLSRYCKQNDIKLSVAFLNRPSYINAFMRNWWGYKGRIVACERTHQTTMLKTRSWSSRVITRFLLKYSYGSVDLVLANSQEMKEDLRTNLHVKTPIEVIYNPVVIKELQTKMLEPVDFVFSPGTFYFIAVGSFRQEKNFPLMIETLAHLKGMNCKLLLIGDGPDEALLRERVKEEGLTEQVIFCGRDKNPFKYIHKCDAFVLCSDVEGFPNVLLEALACGKPVISTDCKSGPREMLAPSTDPTIQLTNDFSVEEFGVLSPVGNAAVLASAMKKVMEDAGLRSRLTERAASRAADFDISIIKKYFVKAFAG